MKKLTQLSILLILGSMMGLYLGGCVHEPTSIPGSPVDTNRNGNPVDTTSDPCDPSVVYFEQQVLPILASGCAIAGCHDPNTREDGVVLNSFDNVVRTGDIKAFNPGGSKLYKMITESDPKKRMPPPPMNSLTAEQKKVIFDWINQGAANQRCDQPANCDTINSSFSGDVYPVIKNHCVVCHSGNSPSGNVSLTNYQQVSNYALNGKLVCVIRWDGYCVKMPSGGNKLDGCSIGLIEAWVRQGSPNN